LKSATAVLRVAVDAMGGDHAPGVVVDGVLAALAAEDRLGVTLVGDEPRLMEALGDRGRAFPDRMRVLHTPHAIGPDETPVEALRAKPGASVRLALQLMAAGEAHAAFGAGNTGAVAVAANMALGRIAGVRRAGIAVVLQRRPRRLILMDVGANLQPRATDLAEYAVLASAYSRCMLGIDEPAVGLLNIGTEQGKGGALLQDAAALVQGIPDLRFQGFVEGHRVLSGELDVIVCDAFTGNAVLKVSEGLAASVLRQAEEVLRETGTFQGDEPRLRRALGTVRATYDYAEYGGAPLLGVGGIVMIGHGRSDARAVASGVRVAYEAARRGLHERLRGALACSGGSQGGV
jgi:glycerol-3-phosphate acyltransferase PlsX